MTTMNIAKRIADTLDRNGAWDLSDGADHCPSDRWAVVRMRRLGASPVWALIYRGTEGDEVTLFCAASAARGAIDAIAEQIATEARL